MNIYVSGGCKNGKSQLAENMARDMAIKEKLPLYYVATMIPKDKEDVKRVNIHRKTRKNKGFETLELKTTEDFLEILNDSGKSLNQKNFHIPAVFLVDSITALLENIIFDDEYNVDDNAWIKITETLEKFMLQAGHVVFVSDFIFSDGVLYDQVTESYRKNLAMCDRRLAEKCDRVCEVSFGCIRDYK